MQRLLSTVLVLSLAVGASAQQSNGQVSFTAPKGWAASSSQGGVLQYTHTSAGGVDGALLIGQDMPLPNDPVRWLEQTARSLAGGQALSEQAVQSEQLASGLTALYKVLIGGTPQQPVAYVAALLHNGTSGVLVVFLSSDVENKNALEKDVDAVVESIRLSGKPTQTAGTTAAAGAGAKPAEPNLPTVNPMNAAQFKAAGGNPARQIIPDEFRCYVKRKGDGLSPDLTVQVLPGGTYRTVYGNGTYQINKDRKITWQGGPLNKADGSLDFDDYGQAFSLSDVSEDTQDTSLNFECYQRGPRENVALHNFKLRTPKPGSYSCVLADGQGDRGALEVGADNTYRFGGAAGRYRVDYRSDQDSARSSLTLRGEGDLEESGFYSEDETGLRVFTLTVPTGGDLISRSSPAWTCTAVAKPTPAPSLYGSEKAPAPPQGSGGLNGNFVHNRAGKLVPVLQIGPDFTSSMVLGSECPGNVCWAFAFFNPNGYVYTQEPKVDASEADCTRTYPNGLPRCEVYRVTGNTIQIGDRAPVPFTLTGSGLNLDGQRYDKLQPMDTLILRGSYESLEVTPNLYLGGSTSSLALTFGEGRTFSLSSDRSTTVMVPGATVSNSNRAATLTGTYKFSGNTVELTYRDGRVVRQFAALPVEGGKITPTLLRIGGVTYSPSIDKK